MEEELRELLWRYRTGDDEAARRLAIILSPLVEGLARRFGLGSGEAEDYCQVGMIGLFKAASRFNLAAPVKFTTFAVAWIKGEMLNYRRHNAIPVKISRTMWEQARVIGRSRHDLFQELKREPTVSEISRATKIPAEDIALVTESLMPFSALNEETAFAREGADQEEELVDRLSLREGMMLLTPIERKIIILRFFQELSQAQIGEALTLTQRQVSRLEKRILGRLRNFLQT